MAWWPDTPGGCEAGQGGSKDDVSDNLRKCHRMCLLDLYGAGWRKRKKSRQLGLGWCRRGQWAVRGAGVISLGSG